MLFLFKYIAAIFFASAYLMSACSAEAQQRTFINGGFEQNDPRGPGNTTFQVFSDSAVIEWSDDTGFIELWDDGYLGIDAYEGDVFAELNANSPGTLFQNICLVNGETLGWSFAHRARPTSIDPQTVFFEIANSSGTLLQSLTSQSSLIGAPWTINSSSTTYTGPTGVQRARFRTTDSGSLGNFLDGLQFDISSFAQITTASESDFESVGGNIPSIQIFGRVDVVTTIPFTVTGGTANTADYTLDATVVTIPIGVYGGETFPLPITIIENTVSEPNETIEISLGTPSSPEVIFARQQCDGAPPQTTATYTILNDDGVLSASKSVAMYSPSGEEVYALPNEDVVYTIRVTNTSTTSTPADALFLKDKLPPELRFYNGDIDDGGPEVNPVRFTSSGSGLSLDYATNVGYSNLATAPASIADCNFNPALGYVETVTYICFAPQGTFTSGSPAPFFEVSFRMQIR